MISEWFNATELSGFNLQDIPATKFGIIKRAEVEGWKFRPRQARGGGVEYHISALPQPAQMALVEKLVGTETLSAMQNSVAEYMAPEQKGPAAPTATERRNAKIVIVSLFEKFMASSCLKTLQAERPFLTFYEREGRLENSTIVPSWVFSIYPTFSIQSLRRWRSLRKQDDAFNALGGRYGNRKGSSIIERAENGELKKYVIAVMLKQPHLNGGHLRDLVRAKYGETVFIKNARGKKEEKELPTVRTFERFMLEWRKENAEIHMRLTNPDGHKNRYQLALGKADAGIDRLNQLWEIDASPADVLCADGRYALYGIIDVYSRRVIYSVTKTAKTEASLLLVRRAILEWGVPEIIRTDNGSDFTSHRFMNALIALGIEQDICPPFSGDKKPFVERSFRTLQHGLMPLMPGYIGHSVKDRKEIESRRAFAQRLGESDEKAFAVGGLSHGDLQIMVDRWVKDHYMHRDHGGIGESPFSRVTAWTKPVKRIENERALDLLLAPVAGGDGYRKIGKKGITLDRGVFMGPDLVLYVGKRVMVRCNPEDMGVVYCFDEEGAFIGEARCFNRQGVNPVIAAAEAKKAQKVFERENIDPLRKEMKKITPAKLADDYLGLASRDNGHLVAMPSRGELYETPQLIEAAKAFEKLSPELAASTAEQERHEAFVAEFNSYQENTEVQQQRDEDRWWDRAQSLIALRDSDYILSAHDAEWLANAETTSWFISRRDFEEMTKNAL